MSTSCVIVEYIEFNYLILQQLSCNYPKIVLHLKYQFLEGSVGKKVTFRVNLVIILYKEKLVKGKLIPSAFKII